jgi:hypothetical protein
MSSRLVTPGFEGEARTASAPVSESVTARATFRRTTSGGSSSRITPASETADDFDIFEAGDCRSITRAPARGTVTSGTLKTRP